MAEPFDYSKVKMSDFIDGVADQEPQTPEPQQDDGVPNNFDKNTPYQLESLCMACYKQGITKFLYTDIPFYGEIILSSFVCEFCHNRDTKITSAKQLAEKTQKFVLKVDPIMCEADEVLTDLSRTVVRTESTIIRIPELGFEIPANRAEINTVEGFLLNILESLAYQQEQRKEQDPENYEKIQLIVEKLEQMKNGEEEFTIELYDPAGHCFITNPFAPATDPRCKSYQSERTAEEYIKLGYSTEDAQNFHTEEELKQKSHRDELLSTAIAEMRKRENKKQRQMGGGKLSTQRGEGYKTGGSKSGLKVMSANALNKKDLDKFENLSHQANSSLSVFPQSCSACRHEASTKMCIIEVPYFGETIVMATTCEHCNYKNTEVRTAQAYGEKGIKITVVCKADSEDLTRDVLKSHDAAILFPDLGLELPSGTLGAKFTSIEGIVQGVYDQIKGQSRYYNGDSESGGEDTKNRVMKLLKDLEDILAGEKEFTFVVDDPAGNSFVEGRVDGVHDTSPFEDPSVTVDYYTRTTEQNDELGLLHMNLDAQTLPEEEDEDDDEEEDGEEEEEEENTDADADKEEAKAE